MFRGPISTPAMAPAAHPGAVVRLSTRRTPSLVECVVGSARQRHLSRPSLSGRIPQQESREDDARPEGPARARADA